MSKLREDVSDNPNEFILCLMKSMLPSQLLISSSDTLQISQGSLLFAVEFPSYLLFAERSLSVYRIQILIGSWSTGEFFGLKIDNSYLLPFSGFCIGAGCQGLTCSRWIHRTAVWLRGALFCG